MGGSEEEDSAFWILVEIRDQVFRAVLDTSATLPIVARRLLNTFKKTKTVAIRVGDGRTIHSLGGVDVTICLGDETVTQHCRVLDTDAFDIVIGTDLLRRNPQVKMLSLQRCYSLHCDFGSGLFTVRLELSGKKESGLRYAAKTNYRSENYQLACHVPESGLAALQVTLDEIHVELFASHQQHIMQLYCSKHLNNAFRFFWKPMGLAYAKTPFSLLAKVLTEIAYEGGRVVMCNPDWGCSGEHPYWRRMLDPMTVKRVQSPDGSIYVPEDSDTAMQAPEWASFLSIVDGSLNPVPLCDLDQVLLKGVMAENRGLSLSDLKKRSPEHLSATLTGCESPDGYLEPAAVKEDADDQLSEIASAIPPVDPRCVELKHSAFLAQLLLEEVDLESTSEQTSPVGKPVLHMQHTHSGEPVAQSPDTLAGPASNDMPLSEHDTQELRRLLYLKAEGIERQERLQYLRQTWKYSIWSEEDDDSYTLPDPEIPLVYSLHNRQQCSPERDDGSVPAETADRQKKKEHGKSNLHAEADFPQKIESLNLDPRLKKLLPNYEELFGALPPFLSCKKLVQMDLQLKLEFERTRVRRRPYLAPHKQVEEIERQIQECIYAGLVEEYKKGDYPHNCSPCFLVPKPGSTALRFVVDYGEVNKKTQNDSASIPNMENTLERIAKCSYKTKMDKRSGFWQVDLTATAQELLAFITPKGRVSMWKVMHFGVANDPALFRTLMNKILYILRHRSLGQELISRGAEIEAHIDDVSLGTNTQEDHVLLPREFFIVCPENHLRIKLEKCECKKEEKECLGFDVGYGWWKPAASKIQQPPQDMQIRDDLKKGLHDVRSFVGACNFYRRHIRNFTYSSAPLTDLIKKTTPLRWTTREEECFQVLKKKIASSNCLGVPRPKGDIVLITDAGDVGGGWNDIPMPGA